MKFFELITLQSEERIHFLIPGLFGAVSSILTDKKLSWFYFREKKINRIFTENYIPQKWIEKLRNAYVSLTRVSSKSSR